MINTIREITRIDLVRLFKDILDDFFRNKDIVFIMGSIFAGSTLVTIGAAVAFVSISALAASPITTVMLISLYVIAISAAASAAISLLTLFCIPLVPILEICVDVTFAMLKDLIHFAEKLYDKFAQTKLGSLVIKINEKYIYPALKLIGALVLLPFYLTHVLTVKIFQILDTIVDKVHSAFRDGIFKDLYFLVADPIGRVSLKGINDLDSFFKGKAANYAKDKVSNYVVSRCRLMLETVLYFSSEEFYERIFGEAKNKADANTYYNNSNNTVHVSVEDDACTVFSGNYTYQEDKDFEDYASLQAGKNFKELIFSDQMKYAKEYCEKNSGKYYKVENNDGSLDCEVKVLYKHIA